MEVGVLIVGQGLAGSTLALHLLKRHKRVLVLDRADPGSSSRVAAGLITPLTGRGMNPAWRQDSYLPYARNFYQNLSENLWHTTPAVRVFLNEREKQKWLNKPDDVKRWAEVLDDIKSIDAPWGGLVMGDAAWLDTHRFLDVTRTLLENHHAYRLETFHSDEIIFPQKMGDAVQWRDVSARHIILCQGAWGLGKESCFAHIEHRSAKGEILTLDLTESAGKPNAAYRYHAQGWIAPRNAGQWKAGATYDWHQLDTNPTEAGKQEILDRLGNWLDLSQPKVTAHHAGVRPIIRSSRPVVGFHPEHSQIGFFNGLGSKGSLMAPAVADHFAGHLCGEHPIDDELNLANL